MALDYNKVKSLSNDDFDKIKLDINKIKSDPNYSKVQPETLASIERFLDLKPGVLKEIEGYIQKQNCSHCKKEITLLDKVITAMVDAEHSKSFMMHTMLGNKRTLSQIPVVRCGNCGTVMVTPASWHFWGFVYCNFAQS